MEKYPKKFKKELVKSRYGWTDWIFPKPTGYLFKCCDCGLIHELQFKAFVEEDVRRGAFKVVKLPEPIRAMFRARRFKIPRELKKSNSKINMATNSDDTAVEHEHEWQKSLGCDCPQCPQRQKHIECYHCGDDKPFKKLEVYKKAKRHSN